MEVNAFLLDTDDLVLILDGFQRSHKQSFGFSIRIREPLVHKNNRVVHISAGLTNRRQQLIENPVLELFSLRFIGAADEAVYISFRDKLDNAGNAANLNATGLDSVLTAVDVQLAGYVRITLRLVDIHGTEIKLVVLLDNTEFAKHFRQENLRYAVHI